MDCFKDCNCLLGALYALNDNWVFSLLIFLCSHLFFNINVCQFVRCFGHELELQKLC